MSILRDRKTPIETLKRIENNVVFEDCRFSFSKIKPLKIYSWQWSVDFGRWRALVDLPGSVKGTVWHGYSYPHFNN
jgi:hypothetical protein